MSGLLAPAGNPITARDFLGIVIARLRGQKGAIEFKKQLAELSGISDCLLVNSGRTAQYLILSALKQIDGGQRDEVVIPAYTCFSVPASAVRAGLKIRPVDIDPQTMDYNYECLAKVDYSRVLAVISANLFGIPSDWEKLNEISRQKSLYLVDDAAQVMGTIHNGRRAGSIGAAGFYSLDRGKNLSTFAGGVLLSDDDKIATVLKQMGENLKKPGLIAEKFIFIKMILYALFLRPSLFGLAVSLPFLKLGETVYDESFAVSQLSRIQICAGATLFDKLAVANNHRKEVGRKLAEALRESELFSVVGYDPDNCPVYLRLPVMCDSRQTRDDAIARLRKAGIVASPMYPSIISDIPELQPQLVAGDKPFDGATAVVERLLTLPTHLYVKEKQIDAIKSCLLG